MHSWLREEIHVPRAWCVYLATGFNFSEKNRAGFGLIKAQICVPSPTLSLYYDGRVKVTIFPPKPCVRIKDNRSHMVSFIDFLFPFSSEFLNLNFASNVLFIYYCDTHSEPGSPVVEIA